MVLAAVGFFDCDLGHVGGRSKNEIRMVNLVVATIGCSNDERQERDRMEQFTNARFHNRKIYAPFLISVQRRDY
jgi:hypothetical protein